MPEVNGFQIKEALKRWELRRRTADQQFQDSIRVFEGDERPSPQDVIGAYKLADESYAKLQELQQWYNQQVTCSVLGGKHTLSYCVKVVGGLGRTEKLWRDACTEKRDRWYREELSRSKDQEYAKRTVSIEEAIQFAEEAAKQASEVRAAIAVGNATAINVGDGGFQITPEQYEALFS